MIALGYIVIGGIVGALIGTIILINVWYYKIGRYIPDDESDRISGD